MLKGSLYRKLIRKKEDTDMPAKTQTPQAPAPKAERLPYRGEKRPTWTMDVMILSGLNDLAKVIDEAAMETETGNVQEMVTWKAALSQFYRNIKSFLNIPVVYTKEGGQQAQTTLLEIAEETFSILNRYINTVQRTIPSDEKSVNYCIVLLGNVNEMLYHARNELFMRMITVMDADRRALDYAFSGLPDKEKNALIDSELERQGLSESSKPA